MALLFSSGGGRLGNQLLNVMHLLALSLEYDLKVEKLNDSFLSSTSKSLSFSLDINKKTWKIVKSVDKDSFLNKYFLKIYIRFLHLVYFIYPSFKSYKISLFGKNLGYILGEKLTKKNDLIKIINQSKKNKVVVSGWGLRDWDSVLKHKHLIKKYIVNGIKLNKIKVISTSSKYDYLLVHIRGVIF